MQKLKKIFALVMFAFLLNACGGGGGGGSSSGSSGGTTTTTSDSSAPVITITGPTSSASYNTTSATLNLSGTASDNVGVTQVSWSNNRGGNGTASGTTSWSVNNIALQTGSNVITVTARDAVGLISTDVLTVTYSTGTTSDTTAPTVSINAPTNSATYSTGSNTLNIAGTAADNVAVTQITWSNNRGGNGNTNVAANWSVNGIILQSGSNIITVTAYDAAGNIASDVLTVTYTPPDTTPPTVSSTSPANNATNVSTSAAISVTFSEAMSAASITTSTFTVNGVSGSVSVSGATATFTPSSALATSTTYTATVIGGSSGVKDAAGNSLASNYSWTFTTSAPLACGGTTVLCVDDTAGATQEYSTIQAAVNVARPGDTVLVYDGTYTGFSVAASGTSSNPIVIKAQGNSALINQANSNGEGITINNASYVTIEGFTVTGMSGYGLATHNASPTSPMHGLTIRNNTVQNSGSTNIYLSEVADSLIEGNSASGSVASHGIYLANGGSDNTILRANRCFNNAKNGIHFNGDLSVGGDGLHSGLTIEKNVLYSNTDNGLDMDGVQDSLIQNNLIYKNGRNALRAFQIDAAAGPKNLKIVNNTLLAPSNGGWALKLSEDLGGHTIFNNILLSDSSSGSISVANTNFVSNNNALVGRLSFNGETTVIDLAAWIAAGYDATSFTTTSANLFVNASSDNYQLKSGAPAINSGRAALNSVSAPATDILDATRPQGGAYDLGAYESN